MARSIPAIVTSCLLAVTSRTYAQDAKVDVPYVDGGHARQVLDIFPPAGGAPGERPVLFWIHGGGWQAGDKSQVGLKPRMLAERGFVLVSTNYRLWPEVTMEELVGDVATSLGWVHRNIGTHGGDPNRIFVAGHSAGAQLAALLCTDDRLLKKTGVPFSALAGCIPVDGDTYDIPKIILTAEHRQAVYGGPMPTTGHRQKFGNDPLKHVDFSAVTHVAPGKQIPPFLIPFFSGNPDTTAQARRLEAVLRAADVPARAIGKGDSNHGRLNDDLGRADDPVTAEVSRFLADPRGTATATPR